MANIVIAFPKMEDAIGIKNLLVRNGYPVTAVCTSGANVLSTIDDYNDGIVVCGYKLTDMLFSELRANMAGDFEMILLASAGKISDADCGNRDGGNRTDGYPDYAWLDKTTLMRKDVVANN